MNNRLTLEKGLKNLGIQPTDTLLIHSSYKAVGAYQGGPEQLIADLMAYFAKGLLIFPTHTWRDVTAQSPIFKPATSPVCVGLLPEIFRKMPGVQRSLHPTHSVAAIGKGATAYLAGEERHTTPCDRQGCWGRLVDLEAKILFLGATLKTNTFIHSVEEWQQIPNRLTKEQEPLFVEFDKQLIATPQHRHIGDVSQTYDKLYQPLIAQKIAQVGKICEATSIVCQSAPMAAYVSTLLTKEPELFSSDQPIPEAWYYL